MARVGARRRARRDRALLCDPLPVGRRADLGHPLLLLRDRPAAGLPGATQGRTDCRSARRAGLLHEDVRFLLLPRALRDRQRSALLVRRRRCARRRTPSFRRRTFGVRRARRTLDGCAVREVRRRHARHQRLVQPADRRARRARPTHPPDRLRRRAAARQHECVGGSRRLLQGAVGARVLPEAVVAALVRRARSSISSSSSRRTRARRFRSSRSFRISPPRCSSSAFCSAYRRAMR
jgi:hypothetical protein